MAWPVNSPARPAPGLYFVATPIGAARDITLRALDLLARYAGVDGKTRFYDAAERLPIEGVVPKAWREAVGDTGVVYLSLGYSAIGVLMNLWMGVEGTHYAIHDWPDLMRGVVREINEANLRLVDLAAQSPAEIILMGDNFSTDIQPPGFFHEWSRAYYVEAVRRLHAAGKHVALHLDGRLHEGLRMLAHTGADAADAVTPKPTGDLTPKQCRAEAGPGFILSGGIAPLLWLPQMPISEFARAAREWLALRQVSPRLIAAAGDQVPPGADEDRIKLLAELVAEQGRYGSEG